MRHSGARERLVLTGAAGAVATALRPSLAAISEEVILTDVNEPTTALGTHETVLLGDLQDNDFREQAFRSARVVIHLAGHPSATASWADLVGPNVNLTTAVLDACVRTEVDTLILASSCHASGRSDIDNQWPVDPEWPARPCCVYGASKVAVETLARVYADRHALHIACLRLGWVQARPNTLRGLSQWLSHRDLGRLVATCVDARPRYGVYFGVSANTRSRWSLTNARTELGYHPLDDAEDYAADIDLGRYDPMRCQLRHPANEADHTTYSPTTGGNI